MSKLFAMAVLCGCAAFAFGAETKADAGYEPQMDKDGWEILFNGKDAWGPLALVDGRMLLRDDKRMICIDLRATGANQ